VFLQTSDATPAYEALGRALGLNNLEQLNLMLAFVRTTHYWTKLHPELAFEDDVNQLLAAHETLAACVLRGPEPEGDSLSLQVAAELACLRKLHKQHDGMTQASPWLNRRSKSVI
jgi:hypothetical protein